MTYNITRSNGTFLTTIADETLDHSTSLTLLGHGWAGYGDIVAKNFVQLLENFANAETAPPLAPMTGQLWYNLTTATLTIWTGSAWANVGTGSGGGATGPTGPTGPAGIGSGSSGPTGATGPTGPAFGRTKLTTDLNLYVATTGNDSFNGAVSTPFRTLQAAWDALMRSYDLAGYTVTINVAAGAYTGVICSGMPCGAASGIPNIPGQSGPAVVFLGLPQTPWSVTVDAPNGNCFSATNGANILVRGFTLTASGTPANYSQVGVGLYAFGSSGLSFNNVVFGACSASHISSCVGSIVETRGSGCSYTITGNAPTHMQAFDNGYVAVVAAVVTITGALTFSSAFARAIGLGVVAGYSNNYNAGTGTVTGVRYLATTNSIIYGGAASYFPGSLDGVTSTGGVYTA